MASTSGPTPMMQQYLKLKEHHADCILFFRLGDFYEMFGEDAIEGSRLLNLTLTKRHETPMCGIPYHAAAGYIGRLTKLGKKIAICEQVSDPTLPGLVQRDVVRVVTPGTTFDERILDEKAQNFIVAVVFLKEGIGLAATDITTGYVEVVLCKDEESLREHLYRLHPAECVVDAAEKNLPEFLKQFEKLPVFPHQFWDEPRDFLAKFFGVKDIDVFGLEQVMVSAAGLLLHYVRETQKSNLTHLRPPRVYSNSESVVLDEAAVRNLELITTLRENSREGSLLSVLDMTKTSMGARLLRSWVTAPSASSPTINARLDALTEIQTSFELKSKLGEVLTRVLDVERLLGRLSVGAGSARDILGIGHSISVLSEVAILLKEVSAPLLIQLRDEIHRLDSLNALASDICSALLDDLPLSIREGNMIREGFSAELDELRTIAREGKSLVQKMQQEEIEKTGINSLKIKYTSVFGYHIEITKSNLNKVPLNYVRKQTMVNAERFITPELKEFEEKILGAEGKMQQLEYELFIALREKVQSHTRELQQAAQVFAQLDVLAALALVAEKNNYIRPTLVASDQPLVIRNGRHPVVEELAAGTFVANHIELGVDSKNKADVLLITGPNMGGKSTYLRQTALIVLLAHMGSFVPAQSADIPLVDRIFTRVGASDNLVRGQSTFMVEMQETAHILHYATKNSLIILDEIGRGTSTYDGVSLAWAILEYIHNEVGAKTLFATHYHELVQVAERLPRAANMSVAVHDDGQHIAFLYRVLPGAVSKSYGIEVARLAGLPAQVLAQARTILHDLEEGVVDEAVSARAKKSQHNKDQLDIFAVAPSPRTHRLLDELQKLNVNELTPLAALQKLDELKRIS